MSLCTGLLQPKKELRISAGLVAALPNPAIEPPQIDPMGTRSFTHFRGRRCRIWIPGVSESHRCASLCIAGGNLFRSCDPIHGDLGAGQPGASFGRHSLGHPFEIWDSQSGTGEDSRKQFREWRKTELASDGQRCTAIKKHFRHRFTPINTDGELEYGGQWLSILGCHGSRPLKNRVVNRWRSELGAPMVSFQPGVTP